MLRISIPIIVALAAVAGVVAAILLYRRGAPYTEIVQTTSGPIRGEELSYAGTNYKAFKGIPYAAAPVGNLRFKDPQPPENWTSVRDTRQFGHACMQERTVSSASEDCLTLNVFTPSLGKNGVKPVIVWIHGGGFSAGSSSNPEFGPEYLIQEDIVVVSINYRVGPLGFLSTSSPDASGNWGMKDQVAALKWVQNNIANFGGDPKQVTIYGESAGGASVHLHLFSPLSKGLFHKVIASSGTAINYWSVESNERSSDISMMLARRLGASEADITDPAKRVEYLRNVDADAITKQGNQIWEEGAKNSTDPIMQPLVFTPVIEKPGTQQAFLTENPKKMMSEGRFPKMPVMIGMTDLEAGAKMERVTTEAMREVEKNVCVTLPEDLKKHVVSRNECAEVAKEIRDAYFGGKPFDSSMLSYAYYATDLFIIREAYLAQRLHTRFSSSDNPIYSYIFAIDGEWNFLKKRSNVTLPGAFHGDDIAYVFKPSYRDEPSNLTPEVIAKNRMVRFWGNFVKYGNPTPSVSDLIPVKWEPDTADTAKAMIIGNELRMENDFLKARMGLWDRLYKKYTRSPLMSYFRYILTH